MISMVEKVTRLELMDCYGLRDVLIAELQENREAFLSCPEILDFEREWVEKYVQRGRRM